MHQDDLAVRQISNVLRMYPVKDIDDVFRKAKQNYLPNTDTPTNKILANNLRKLTTERRFSINYLSGLTGIGRRPLTSLINCESKMIKFSTIDRLAKALGVQPVELFEIR